MYKLQFSSLLLCRWLEPISPGVQGTGTSISLLLPWPYKQRKTNQLVFLPFFSPPICSCWGEELFSPSILSLANLKPFTREPPTSVDNLTRNLANVHKLTREKTGEIQLRQKKKIMILGRLKTPIKKAMSSI